MSIHDQVPTVVKPTKGGGFKASFMPDPVYNNGLFRWLHFAAASRGREGIADAKNRAVFTVQGDGWTLRYKRGREGCLFTSYPTTFEVPTKADGIAFLEWLCDNRFIEQINRANILSMAALLNATDDDLLFIRIGA